MKRITSLALALILIFTLVGCSGSKPDTVVSEFCTAMQAFDLEAAAACMENGSEDLGDMGLEDDPTAEQLLTYVKGWAAEMTYEIGEATVDGETASVPVTFTYVDSTPVITAALGEYIAQAFGLALSGAGDDQIEALFTGILSEKVESIETGTATAEVTFNCTMVDGAWKISAFAEGDDVTLVNVLTCNIMSAFEELDEAFAAE